MNTSKEIRTNGPRECFMPEIFEKDRKIKVIEYGTACNDLAFNEMMCSVSQLFKAKFSSVFGRVLSV